MDRVLIEKAVNTIYSINGWLIKMFLPYIHIFGIYQSGYWWCQLSIIKGGYSRSLCNIKTSTVTALILGCQNTSGWKSSAQSFIISGQYDCYTLLAVNVFMWTLGDDSVLRQLLENRQMFLPPSLSLSRFILRGEYRLAHYSTIT